MHAVSSRINRQGIQTNSFSRIKGKVPYNFFWRFVYFFELHVILSFSSWKVQENNRFRSNRHSRVEMCPMAPCAICGYPWDRGTARGMFFSHENFVYLLLSCCYLSHTHIPSHKVNVPILQPSNVSVPLQTKMTISLPSHTLQLVKSQQFHIHQAVKRVTLFWAEPPVWGIIGSTPPPSQHTPPPYFQMPLPLLFTVIRLQRKLSQISPPQHAASEILTQNWPRLSREEGEGGRKESI